MNLLLNCDSNGPLSIGRLSYIHLTTVSALQSPVYCFRFVKALLSAQVGEKDTRQQEL